MAERADVTRLIPRPEPVPRQPSEPVHRQPSEPVPRRPSEPGPWRPSEPGPWRPPQQEPLWREVLGHRLRALRHDQQETLSETAGRAGISPQYLSEVERGRKEPSSEMIAALAGALGITLTELTEQLAGDLRRQRGTATELRVQQGIVTELRRQRGFVGELRRQRGFGTDLRGQQGTATDMRRQQGTSRRADPVMLSLAA